MPPENGPVYDPVNSNRTYIEAGKAQVLFSLNSSEKSTPNREHKPRLEGRFLPGIMYKKSAAKAGSAFQK
ncbi:hypothetical protein GCM10011383_07380 [Hymenobacter cavernae]|uniref:Uncharacterized protein n=1 Tax=Hymenobacter cavernae TaxID=2044852 RepID=A0ABQ1TR49_9BACT|nr:hypothetical protein GCM10011383_07380 [Hymenobacter cavernae]